jgi:hypothetical protein
MSHAEAGILSGDNNEDNNNDRENLENQIADMRAALQRVDAASQVKRHELKQVQVYMLPRIYILCYIYIKVYIYIYILLLLLLLLGRIESTQGTQIRADQAIKHS